MKNRGIIFALLIALINSAMTGCWNSREINTLAFATAVGIDKGQNGKEITVQILNPRAITSKIVTHEPAVLTYTEQGKNVLEAIERLTAQMPRLIYLSHMRVVVFGERYAAEEGISDVLDFLARNHEVRTDFYFVIAKEGTAHDVLTVLSRLEAVPANKIHDELKTSEKFWAPTKTIRIVELVNDIVAEGKDPVLTGLEITGGQIRSNSIQSLGGTEAINQLELKSLAVFKDDKLAGWLNEDESRGYNYITGNVNNTVGYIMYGSGSISIYVTKAEARTKIYFAGGKPSAEVLIDVEGDVGSVRGQVDVTKEETLKELGKIFSENLAGICKDSVEKAQSFGADIFGFGEEIHRSYPKEWKKIKKQWDMIFKNLPVKITVNCNVKGFGAISKPYFLKESE